MGGMIGAGNWKQDEFRNTLAANPDFVKAIKESSLDEVDSMSIGKLRAICEKNGIKAGKMRRAELSRNVRSIISK